MKRFRLCFLIGGLSVLHSTLVAAQPCSGLKPPAVELGALKVKPELFDGRKVSISGTLKSGHLAVMLQGPDRFSIRLRANDELKSKSPKACEDSLYRRLWSLSEQPRSTQDEAQYVIELEGSIRILKDRDGRPAKEFSVFGQWPVELIVTRVLKIEEIPDSFLRKER